MRPPASATTPYTVSLDKPSSRDSTLKRIASGAAAEPCARARPPPSVATHTRSRASIASAYTVFAGSVPGSRASWRNTLTTVPSARARSSPPPSVPIQKLPCESSAIAVTCGELSAPGVAEP
jgi:hypothetical protein